MQINAQALERAKMGQLGLVQLVVDGKADR